MKHYELTLLISSELSEEEVKSFEEKVISFIQDEGGILSRANSLSKKRLPQPIEKQIQVYLAVLLFQTNPEKITSLEKKLKAESQILRYLILTKKEPKIVPEVAKILPMAKKPIEAVTKKSTVSLKEKKVELKEIEKKLEEILNEPQ